MRLGQCGRLPRRKLRGKWIRAIHPRYSGNPLSTAHTPTHATRFNPGTPADPAFEILYLAEDSTVALFEVQALLGSTYPGAAIALNPAGGPWSTIEIVVNLQAVVDFTRKSSLGLIDTSVQELTGDWQAYALRNPKRLRGGIHGSDVPTQNLGRQMDRVRGVEGFITYSARIATRRILIVFPHKLGPRSRLGYRESGGNWVTIP